MLKIIIIQIRIPAFMGVCSLKLFDLMLLILVYV